MYSQNFLKKFSEKHLKDMQFLKEIYDLDDHFDIES